MAAELNAPGLGLDSSPDESLRALHYILAAWEEGVDAGIAPEFLAYAAMYTALTDLVGNYGEAHVTRLVEGLKARVASGEFTVRGRTQ